MFGPAHDLFLIDASSFIYRAHFASKMQDPAYQFNERGEPIGALKFFTERLYHWRNRGIMDRYATHMACVFDASRRSFRHDIYPEYKAHREETPDDLKPQLPLMRDAAAACGIAAVEMIGLEADDLLAVYSLTAVEQGGPCLIVSGDKDLYGLVRPGVMIFDPPSGMEGMRGYRPEKRIGPDEVFEKFGVEPHLVADVQALAGDPTDGIPGAKGIGLKIAAELVQRFGSLEAVLANANQVTQPARRKALIEGAEIIRISKRLVSLDSCADYDTPIEEMELASLNRDRALAFAELHGLTSLARRITKNIEWDESH